MSAETMTTELIIPYSQPGDAMEPTVWMDTEALEARTGMPKATLVAWRYHGKGPRYARMGKHVRYRLADVEAWEQEIVDQQSAKGTE